MIMGIEFGLTLLGIYTLIKQKWPLGKKGYLVGREAKILGILSVLTFPVVYLIGVIVGFFIVLFGGIEMFASSPWFGIAIEAAIVLVWAAPIFYLNARYGREGRVIGKHEAVPTELGVG